MSSSGATPAVPVYRGTVAGVGAWLAGYALTYAATIDDVAGANLTRYVEAVTGEPAAWRVVGWLYYNAHNVGTLVPELFGAEGVNLLRDTDPLPVLLFLVPPAVLLAAGAAVRLGGPSIRHESAALYGLTVMLGYVPAAVVGSILLTTGTARGPAGPEPLASLLLVGVLYPAVFGALGALAGNLPPLHRE